MILIKDFLLFVLAVGGLALPWFKILRSWPITERLSLALSGALISGYLVLFGLYVSGLSLRWFWPLPVAGFLLGTIQPEGIRTVFTVAFARSTILRWLVVAAWCLGWQCFVSSYSGAAWQGDWLEHYDRAHYFLARWPVDFRFLDYYLLPARPPLVNVWAAGFLSGSGGAFLHYQVFMTLLATLVYVPLAGLVERWHGGQKGQAILMLILMANPLFVQNATFPWTKLPAAFFVVLACTLVIPGRDRPLSSEKAFAACVVVAGGLLAHYSAAPWICAFAVAWLLPPGGWKALGAARHGLAWGTTLAGLLLLTWFGWAIHTFGATTTFTGNTALALAPDGSFGERAGRALMNTWHTISPYHHVGLGHPLLAQRSDWGLLRDGWFLGYQLKLPWALGSIGGACLVWLFWRQPGIPPTRFGVLLTLGAILFGTVTHSIPDRLGLTHIALQPLVLLGLAWLASHAAHLPQFMKVFWALGLLLDLAMGILLHFGVQSIFLSQWSFGIPEAGTRWSEYTLAAQTSFANKTVLGLRFLADELSPLQPIGLLVSSLLVALFWWRREMTSPQTPLAS